AVPQYRVQLTGTQVNFGKLQRSSQKPDQALQWYAKAIDTLDGVLRKVKVDATAQQFLRNAHQARAEALDDLKRYTEAARDWDKAVKLSPQAERPQLRMNRAISRVRAGEIDAALKEAEELARTADAVTLYNAACVFALAADHGEEIGGSLSK